jgi:hypothetical protein
MLYDNDAMPARTPQRPLNDMDVPPEWAGREPIFPREAKVYALA